MIYCVSARRYAPGAGYELWHTPRAQQVIGATDPSVAVSMTFFMLSLSENRPHTFRFGLHFVILLGRETNDFKMWVV
jgi:hypothetical protein